MKKTLSILIACFLFLLSSSALAEGTVYTATGDDESALDVSGTEQLELTGVTVQKTDGNASSADAASFRGVNSAVRVYDSAVLTLSDSIVEAERHRRIRLRSRYRQSLRLHRYGHGRRRGRRAGSGRRHPDWQQPDRYQRQ